MVHSYSHRLILSFPPCSWPTGIASRLNNGSHLNENLSEHCIILYVHECTYCALMVGLLKEVVSSVVLV